MKYTPEYLNSLSFKAYLELMATELNENGFREFKDIKYRVFDDPKSMRLFMMGPVQDPKAMAFLKERGLIENGRCPNCGAPMSVYRYTWSDQRAPSLRWFYVCYGCSRTNGHGDGHSMDGCPSGAPKQNSSGCMIAFLMIPIILLKAIFN